MKEMRYAVVIERDSAGVSAYVPDLPGCVAAAQSVEEVRALIQGAIRMHVAGLQEDGHAVPEPSSQVEYVDA
jgi:predicted RNase H-like HicB family nuclease